MLLFVIAVLVVGLDQYTKHLVREHIPVNTSWDPIPALGHLLTFTHVRNTGAAFGLFPKMGAAFIVVALIVVLLIAVYYRQLAGSSWLLTIALGLQLGGAVGNNLVDRLIRGYVTDFVDVHIWPVFNVADSSVVVGTALLAYYALFCDVPEAPPREATEEAQATP